MIPLSSQGTWTWHTPKQTCSVFEMGLYSPGYPGLVSSVQYWLRLRPDQVKEFLTGNLPRRSWGQAEKTHFTYVFQDSWRSYSEVVFTPFLSHPLLHDSRLHLHDGDPSITETDSSQFKSFICCVFIFKICF